MKKILFLLLLSASMYGQVPADATPLENIQITNNVEDNASTKVTVQNANGVQNWKFATSLPVSTATANALDLKVENSAGAIQGFAITDNGNGTVNIATGTAYLRTTNDTYAPLIKYVIPAVTNLALTDNANNFVLVDYNGGTPALTVSISPGTVNTMTNSIAYVISRVGNTLDYVSLIGQNIDANGKLRRRFLNSEGLKRANGAVLSGLNRNLILTSGLYYSGLIEVPTPAFNTSTSGTFTQAYLNGGSWVRTTGNTQINNTQYSLAGVLTTMPSNDYRVDYVYILADNPSKLYVLLGNTTYNNIGSARLAPVPSDLPSELQFLGTRVGRIIIQKDATTMEVSSEFATIYQAGSAQLHNDLGGLNAGDFQHLTVVEKTGLLFKATISQIRALSGTLPNNNFYTTDLGQEGNWYYDASDTTSTDNIGTILVTADGKRIKRVYSGAVNVSWYGIFPNLGTNFSSSFITVLGLHNEIFIPSGNYNIIVPTSTAFSNKIITGVKPSWGGTTIIGGTKITGSIGVTGSDNAFENLGIYNVAGNGFTLSTNASRNTIKNCILNVQDHGVLIEQFGGTATDNIVRNCDAYGGIHGFVSKSKNATFFKCRSFGASTDGFAIVSDNITGVSFPSIASNNSLIDCEAYNTNTGFNFYSRDYSSTTNTAGILLLNLSVVGGNIDTCSSYGIAIGDSAATGSVPAGQTFNDVSNVSINGVKIQNTAVSNIQLGRSNGVYIGGNNLKGLVNKAFSFCKNLNIEKNNNNNFSQGNSVFNTINTANATSIDASLINEYVETNNTASTLIGTISNGKVGQVMKLFVNDDFTTITKSSSIRLTKWYLKGKGSFVILKYANDGSGWDELFSYSVGKLQFFSYASATTIDYKFSEIAENGLTGNISSIVFTNMLKNSPFKLILKWDGTTRTVAGWDSRIIWLSGTAPTSVGSDRLVFDFYFDGTNIINIYRSDLANSTSILKTGDQTATGRKTFTSDNTTVGGMNILNSRTTNTGGTNDATGLFIDNTGNEGLRVNTLNTTGSVFSSNGSGTAMEINASGTGIGLSLRRQTGSGDLLNAELGVTRIQSTGRLSTTLAPVSGNDVTNKTYVDNTIKAQTGWANYSTTTYTSASPFSIAPTSTVTLPNNANNSIITDLPLGVTAFYDGTTNKIMPNAIGDAYIINVRFKAKTTTNNDYLTLYIDIGSGAQINAEAKQFLKGANTEQAFSFTLPIFTLATFVSNGGLIKITSNAGTISVYDITYFITRNHTR